MKQKLKRQLKRRRFVVISGLPGSGKSTLGRGLAHALKLAIIDKDEILEALYDQKGVGDAAWRRQLSRESDRIFESQAKASTGAILISHWHLAGMASDSGTPTEWMAELGGVVVHIHCVCPVEIAAERFRGRRRHAGHLDGRPYAEILASLQQTERLGKLGIGTRLDVDTSRTVDVEAVVLAIENLLAKLGEI